jgi:threonine dehydrogenase-like Zn-dependent dehydrogenase
VGIILGSMRFRGDIRPKGGAMKALALDSFDDGPKVMDVPDPVAGPGEVLVRVAAASLNAFDVSVAAGSMKDFMPYEFPAVIGNDLAGRVEAVGDGVEGFAAGERVFGMMGMRGGSMMVRSRSSRTHRPRRSRPRPRACRTPMRGRWGSPVVPR